MLCRDLYLPQRKQHRQWQLCRKLWMSLF